jgi:pyruvate formate lyase activating enzyme
VTESSTSFDALLARQTVQGHLLEELPNRAIRCVACGHRCLLPDGKVGICKVRFNDGGKLRVPRGYVAALQCDPVEKKPFFHVRPGALALSFGMLGCDYHCAYCQNWITSQALRDPVAGAPIRAIEPDRLVDLALANGAEIVVSTYNEPLITGEWAVEVFKVAKACGLSTAFVSNGNATPEALDYLCPWLDFYKVDLKGFDGRQYRKLGGVLENVLATIRGLRDRNIWTEVVTLIVPGMNDSDEELTGIAEFLASVSIDLPWHVTAFHPDYKMADRGATGTDTLLRAVRFGREAGLRYVYAGNIPGRVGTFENTYCPGCRKLLVERRGFRVVRMEIRDGRCPACGSEVAGAWGASRSIGPSMGVPYLVQ